MKKEVKLGTSDIVNVVLQTDALNMDEVVVTAIGIEREKKAIGYSVQEVGGKDLVSSREVNIVNAISSKVAGVQINSSSGAAGASSFIQIRGASSMTGNNQPLFVIDGVPIDNSQSYSGNPDNGTNNLLESVAYSNRAIDLNPEDVESMTVLKGPAATALYGIRATAGAIIITTKKGTPSDNGKINISYSSSLAFDTPSRLPELQNKFAQGSNGKWYGPETSGSSKVRSWGPLLDTMKFNGDASYIWDGRGKLVGKSDPTGKTQATPYDNLNTFFQTGHTYNNSVTLSGGSNTSNFYFSFSDLNSTGIVPLNTFERTTFKVSAAQQIAETFKASGTVNYIKSGGNRIEQGSNVSGVMLGLLRTPPSFDNANGYSDPVNNVNAYTFPDGSQRTYRGGAGFDNPNWVVNQNPLDDYVNRVIGNVQLDYVPMDWMNFTYRLGTDAYSDRRRQHFAIGSGTASSGRVMEDQQWNNDINSDLIMTMNHKFNEDMNGSLIVGNNMFQTNSQQVYVQGDGLTIPAFYHISNAQSVLSREYEGKIRRAAFYGDAKFDYKNMVFLDVTGRNEWSTTLPSNNNNFFYPSASVSYVFSEALGLKADDEYLSFGKFRLSWAKGGNDAPIYSLATLYSLGTFADGWTNGISFPFNGTPGFTYSDVLGNANLKPESTTSIEVGLELKMLKNRMGIDFTYYQNEHTDQIFLVPDPASTGFRFVAKNAGTMENSGIELILSGRPIETRDLSVDLSVNFAKNTNLVKSLAPGVESIFIGGFNTPQIRAVAGQAYGTVYGGKWLRDAKGNMVIDDEKIYITDNGKGGFDTTANGNYGKPIVDATEGILGKVSPDWTAGIRATITYKALSISALLDIRKGGVVWNGTRGALYSYGTAAGTLNRGTSTTFSGVLGHLDDKGNIVSSGSANNINTVLSQAWYLGNGGGFGAQTEDFVEDASWTRLRELTISYALPKEWFAGMFIKSVNVWTTAKNLWLSTNYQGIDPETSLTGSTNSQGIDYFNMPNTKSWTFGLQLGL